MRIGAKKRPFYRVVAVDERRKRTGGYLELLGTYNPLTAPKEIKLNQLKIDEWLKKGAQPSDGFLRIIGKAPQKPPRKAKKVKGESKEAPAQAVVESTETEKAAPVETEIPTEIEVTPENTSETETEQTDDSSETPPEVEEEPNKEQA